MPLTQFICPLDGQDTAFSYCFRDCQSRCHPLPVLAAMLNDRPHEPGVFHVTEVFNPPKVVWLHRHKDYAVEPEANAYTAFGTAYHLLMESGEKRLAEFGVTDTAVLEQSFRAEIKTPHGTAILTGRADRYEPDTKTLWDYKTEKLYSVKKYLAGNWEGAKHPWQLSTYRTYLFPEAEHLMLSCLIKDHGYQAKVREGIKAIVSIEVPIHSSGVVLEVVAAKIGELLKNEQDPSTIRDCQPDELWDGKRCEEYCPVNRHCQQYLGRTTHVHHKKNIS
jgi:hypothetical protein